MRAFCRTDIHAMPKKILRIAVLTSTVLAVAVGCSTKDAPRSSVNYRNNKVLPTLVVPPDLTTPSESSNLPVPGTEIGTASLRASTADVPEVTETKVLPEVENIRFKGAGDLRWLEVRAPIDDVFKAAEAFVAEQGLTIKDANPTLGRLETDWAESKPGVTKKGSWKNWFTAWQQADYRDRFSVWLERSESPGYVNVYLSHFGLERAFRDPDVDVLANTNLLWQARPTDHALEAEMLVRFAIYLGLSDNRARQLLAGADKDAVRARIVLDQANAEPYLEIDQPFDQAWARTVNAVDRNGLSVASLNKERGRIEIGHDKKEMDALWPVGSPLLQVDFGKSKDPKFYVFNLSEVDTVTTRLDVAALQGEGAETQSRRRLLQFLEQQLR
jgi:outer membrane protein assembly factor BamC